MSTDTGRRKTRKRKEGKYEKETKGGGFTLVSSSSRGKSENSGLISVQRIRMVREGVTKSIRFVR
ncbi:hypothetical protein WN51_11939 [Melipona quadrifasciata]|uniref:Uncharacterized protein n=1 Tax=Melipona quadrifasciata TaxID=166423 RepID=A0A0M9A5D2_9HYME|nr:hypothetical protein WN51_11939 [Melipona quadrifasciata]